MNNLVLLILIINFLAFGELRTIVKRNATQLVSQNDTMYYLKEFGYVKNMTEMDSSAMEDAIMDFEDFAGIDLSGELDNETIALMQRPRCGRADNDEDDSRRKKRYSFFGNRIWDKRVLTYSLISYIDDLQPDEVLAELGKALQLWSELTKIQFKPEINNTRSADITVEFKRQDGIGKVIGYAHNPTKGKVILDKDELWTTGNDNGVNLFQAAVHEFGHSLGLGHSDNRKAVMYPYYMGFTPNFALHIDDIKGIKILYKESLHFDDPKSGDNAILCEDPKIDTIFAMPDNFVYVLKGKHYWKFTPEFIMIQGPNLIKNKWPGLPNCIDAAFTAWNNVTYFFKDKHFWKYYPSTGLGKPKLLKETFKGIPSHVDAAFIWSGDGRLYFFKGNNFWRHTYRNVSRRSGRHRYPLSISRWNGLPNYLEAAAVVNGVSYFFKNGKYYMYDDMNTKIDVGYPRNMEYDLFDCA